MFLGNSGNSGTRWTCPYGKNGANRYAEHTPPYYLSVAIDPQKSFSATKIKYPTFKKHARAGRPLGQEGFVENLEKMTGRILELKNPEERRRNK